jgi:PIN domain nuclease of toxin-antitoxin system
MRLLLDTHVASVERLPPRHQDPFDRLLVVQALTEPLRLVTHDAAVAQYTDTAILV